MLPSWKCHHGPIEDGVYQSVPTLQVEMSDLQHSYFQIGGGNFDFQVVKNTRANWIMLVNGIPSFLYTLRLCKRSIPHRI